MPNSARSTRIASAPRRARSTHQRVARGVLRCHRHPSDVVQQAAVKAPDAAAPPSQINATATTWRHSSGASSPAPSRSNVDCRIGAQHAGTRLERADADDCCPGRLDAGQRCGDRRVRGANDGRGQLRVRVREFDQAAQRLMARKALAQDDTARIRAIGRTGTSRIGGMHVTDSRASTARLSRAASARVHANIERHDG